ncbi:uncharacterized protein EDB91DRAFT_859195 [Suillus paluster]|uniref:uncharacterized protein n=1 Tax=Suillus paluster TaxID=48578 RepID=UPI001B8773DC|nr:uncharacterized protein EDB91DRAFT_859195 [Suillus paluster]KAG1728384.1 hypothetical protein EDB91DRAFT_859195 [Suillus paluster]
MEESKICSSISRSSSYSSNTITPASSPSAGTGGHHDISQLPRIGIPSVDQGSPTERTMSSNRRAYIHPGYPFFDFPDNPVSPVTPDDEYGLDDISGSPPPPSSSPIAYQDSSPRGDEYEETISHSSSGSCRYLLDPTAHAEAESDISDRLSTKRRLLSDAQANTPFVQFSYQGDPPPSTRLQLEKKSIVASSERCSSSYHIKAHPSSRSRTSKTLRTAKSLSRPHSTVGGPSKGCLHKRGTLLLEHLGESAEQEPPPKKARIGRLASHRTDLPKIRTAFSKEPASLRRAQSLISQTSTERDDEDVVKVR